MKPEKRIISDQELLEDESDEDCKEEGEVFNLSDENE